MSSELMKTSTLTVDRQLVHMSMCGEMASVFHCCQVAGHLFANILQPSELYEMHGGPALGE